MSKAERIKMVERNLRENDLNLSEGRITAADHETIRRDGKKCLSEIRARGRDGITPTRKTN